jgi:mRNA interferase RelE/StbE
VTYRVELTPRARRDLRKLPHQVQARLQFHIDALGVNPRSSGVTKLAGKDDTYRIRVGAYRVLYQIHDRVLIVLVVKVASRREAYR